MMINLFFFFNDTATTESDTDVHTLSLHDALPIGAAARGAVRAEAAARPGVDRQAAGRRRCGGHLDRRRAAARAGGPGRHFAPGDTSGGRSVADRKSTRLNSSH